MTKPPSRGKTDFFDELFAYVGDLRARAFSAEVQDYNELRYMYELMRGAGSYLEIGTSFGGSMSALASALRPGGFAVGVDMPKAKKAARTERYAKLHREIADKLLNERHVTLDMVYGDSTHPDIIAEVADRGPFDYALIDGDHRYAGIKADLQNYGGMAKTIFLHDLCLPDVRRAFDEQPGDKHTYGNKFIIGVIRNEHF